MTIKILDSYLVSQIAAGEVVERPSSVIKELLENSLDAGATEINLIIENGGTRAIKITDNGWGIAKEELSVAVMRHTTSKINAIEDLSQVRTFGFRGEALASIAAVSKFRLASRVVTERFGWELLAQQGVTETALQPVAHAVGTTVEANELFFNLPVRKRFLRKEPTEFGHILEIVGRIALSRFDISLTLQHNGRLIWSFAPVKNESESLARVGKIVGEEFCQHAYRVELGTGEFKVSGWISAPAYTRNQPDLQHLYINGRVVRDKTISHAIRQAYQDVIPAQRHPVVVLYLEMDPQLVDVNVHPSKAEVRFCDSRSIHDLIAKGLKEVLLNASKAQYLPQDSEETTISQVALGSAPEVHEWHNRAPKLETTSTGLNKYPSLMQSQRSRSVGLTFTTPKLEGDPYVKSAPVTAPIGVAVASTVRNAQADLEFVAENRQESLVDSQDCRPKLGFAMAQLNNSYILAESCEGLVIVDMHAAHERITYEKLKAEYSQKKGSSQGLLIPYTLSMTAREMEALEANQEFLQQLGFEITVASMGTILVRAIPALLGNSDVEQLVHDLVAGLLEVGFFTGIQEKTHALLATMACHGSLRFGDKLTMDDMNALLREVEKTDFGDCCSHGRPTWKLISLQELKKMFLR